MAGPNDEWRRTRPATAGKLRSGVPELRRDPPRHRRASFAGGFGVASKMPGQAARLRPLGYVEAGNPAFATCSLKPQALLLCEVAKRHFATKHEQACR